MKNMIEVLDLGHALRAAGIQDMCEGFEGLYSRLSQEPGRQEIVQLIEERTFEYFASLRLPAQPTLYDHLVLSLRPKDLVATFNWDPLLFQAMCRNHRYAPMPRAIYLHGNVAIGYCERHELMSVGPRDAPCQQCGSARVASRLLFPVAQKDYTNDALLSLSWRAVRQYLKSAFVFTIFGYSAPSTDTEAVSLLREGWGPSTERNLEEIEIIDILNDDELHETWKGFIHTHHYQCFRNMYNSTIGLAPRRTCEAMWEQLMECHFVRQNRIPVNADWDELRHWIEPLVDAESSPPASR